MTHSIERKRPASEHESRERPRRVGVQSGSDRPNENSDLVIDITTGWPLVTLSNRSRAQLACKRAMDVAGAAVAIIVLSPLLVLTYLLVVSTSRGPGIYRQTRTGKNGSEFTFMKFRSMYDGAHELKSELHDLNLHDAGPIFKIREDPRITPLGRIIRRTSIDELPQLFHVLSGKMSLVGPRPPLPEEVSTYGPRELSRLAVKPGLTCIWQVSGRSDVGFEQWVEMDIEYIQNWSISLDLAILFKTLRVVLSGHGAY